MKNTRRSCSFLMLGLPSDFRLDWFYDAHLGTYRKGFQKIFETYPDYFQL